jgi:hypothetical protein
MGNGNSNRSVRKGHLKQSSLPVPASSAFFQNVCQLGTSFPKVPEQVRVPYDYLEHKDKDGVFWQHCRHPKVPEQVRVPYDYLEHKDKDGVFWQRCRHDMSVWWSPKYSYYWCEGGKDSESWPDPATNDDLGLEFPDRKKNVWKRNKLGDVWWWMPNPDVPGKKIWKMLPELMEKMQEEEEADALKEDPEKEDCCMTTEKNAEHDEAAVSDNSCSADTFAGLLHAQVNATTWQRYKLSHKWWWAPNPKKSGTFQWATLEMMQEGQLEHAEKEEHEMRDVQLSEQAWHDQHPSCDSTHRVCIRHCLYTLHG